MPCHQVARGGTTLFHAFFFSIATALSSTVQEQDEQKRQTVAKLIEKFEVHKYKEQFLQDVNQMQKINRFSEASQRLLKDMNQTEIFKLQKLGSFIADADKISGTIEGLNQFLIVILLMAISSERIAPEDQNMVQ